MESKFIIASIEMSEWGYSMSAQGFAIAILMLFPLICFAAAQDKGSSGLAEKGPADIVEEILITGDRSFRARLMSAEVRAYDLFNQFNDDGRFHISCAKQSATGTRIESQTCAPQFVLDARQSHARDYRSSLANFLDPHGVPDGSVSPQSSPAEAVIAGHLPAYRLKMKQIAEEHPEFLQALIEYSNLKDSYERSRSSDAR